MNRRLVGALLFGLGVPFAVASLTLERTIPLPGVEGRIDHFSVDVPGARLFVAALGNNTVEVVDLKQGRVVRSLTGFAEPQGVVFLPEINRLYVAGGGDGTLRILDGTSFETIKSVSVGDDADNLRSDPSGMQVYVGYGSGALGVLDAATGEGFIDVFEQTATDQYNRVESVRTEAKARTCYFTGDFLYLAVPRCGNQSAEIRCYRLGP